MAECFPSLPSDSLRQAIAAVIPTYLPQQRWFINKAQRISAVDLRDWVALPLPCAAGVLALIDVRFADVVGDTTYFLPLVVGPRVECDSIGVVDTPDGRLALGEAFGSREFCRAILAQLARGELGRGQFGDFRFVRLGLPPEHELDPRRLEGEQSNTSVRYGDSYMLKAFRKVASGVNPDREVGCFLTRRSFANVPALAGYLEYRGDHGWSADLAVLHRFVANDGDAWTHTLRGLRGLYDSAVATSPDLAMSAVAAHVRRHSLAHLADANRLGWLTGDLHNALASDPSDPDFRPDELAQQDILDWVDLAVLRLVSTTRALESAKDRYGDEIARQIAILGPKLDAHRAAIEGLSRLPLAGVHAIRLHGDYHLGQVIRAKGDFVILDFEGEPLHPLSVRRAKQLAAKDVAGMLRSYHYAASAALLERDPNDRRRLHACVDCWLRLTRAAFLDGYFAQTAGCSFWPPDRGAAEQLIAIFELDKACYELAYEAASRPDWLAVPLGYLTTD